MMWLGVVISWSEVYWLGFVGQYFFVAWMSHRVESMGLKKDILFATLIAFAWPLFWLGAIAYILRHAWREVLKEWENENDNQNQ